MTCKTATEQVQKLCVSVKFNLGHYLESKFFATIMPAKEPASHIVTNDSQRRANLATHQSHDTPTQRHANATTRQRTDSNDTSTKRHANAMTRHRRANATRRQRKCTSTQRHANATTVQRPAKRHAKETTSEQWQRNGTHTQRHASTTTRQRKNKSTNDMPSQWRFDIAEGNTSFL